MNENEKTILLEEIIVLLTKIEQDFRRTGADESELAEINKRFKIHDYNERLKV